MDQSGQPVDFTKHTTQTIMKKVAASLLKRTSLFIVMLAAVVVIMVMLTAVSLNLMSALRACVSGESLWSKAHKDAIAAISRYAERGNDSDYQQF